jgi:WhiB family transcriptional regulator, redox-sensing transcriptional regulator
MTVHRNRRGNAACRDADPDLFFSISTTGAALRQIEEAKPICLLCPAQIQCLARARENGVTDGV